MSAGTLPYHLRPNKAVDRFLFLDLLSKLDPVLRIDSTYRYVGFGGPQMEDFRLLHERFPNLQMLCIESSEPVLRRQKFNRPHTNVALLEEPMESKDWLTDWNPTDPTIIWFDYAFKKERPTQFREFQTLLREAPHGSLIRITMNADLPKAETKGGEAQLNHLKTKFGALLPAGLDPNDITAANFPDILVQMFRTATRDVLKSHPDRYYRTLLITSYRDTNQMMTLTGILDTPENCQRIVDVPVIREWEYSCFDWENINNISMPDLTVKERIRINENLPALVGDPEAIHASLDCWVDEDEAESLNKLNNYADFYRHFPQFVRAAV